MRQTVGHSGLANMTLPEKRMMLRIHCTEALLISLEHFVRKHQGHARWEFHGFASRLQKGETLLRADRNFWQPRRWLHDHQ